ncbi:MAG: DUF962 domain-containing protein [Burkholderiales bacterium]|nr:DUF962 domain-containing protein [Burkholderiales bacterium]MDE2277368.1 DUF962 domain-containing protein [Burkholderiales bacterium]
MATPFRPAVALLAQYAAYHRDRRNIATHFVGVPMIVFAVGVLLAGVRWPVAGLALTPAWALFALVSLWYLTRGAAALGLVTSMAVGGLIALAHRVGGASASAWLAWGLGCFVAGWIIQFIGHYYEGRKPAFADDLVGLLVAPLFLTLEAVAPLGLCRPLMREVEQRAGPTLIRDLAHPATR